MFYHDNQSKCLFLISLCSLRHNTWIYISSIDKPLYSILYLLNFPVAWKKCPAFSLLFYPYFSFISETAVSETVVSEIMLMFIVWIIDCYLLIFDACFCIWKMCFSETAVSEVFYAILNSLLVLGFCCFCVCRILLLKAKKLFLLIAEAISENLFFEPRSEVFWGLFLLYCDARKKHRNLSFQSSQCFKWTIAMVYSLYFDALSTDFMCSVFIEDKTWINRDIEQRSL